MAVSISEIVEFRAKEITKVEWRWQRHYIIKISVMILRSDNGFKCVCTKQQSLKIHEGKW